MVRDGDASLRRPRVELSGKWRYAIVGEGTFRFWDDYDSQGSYDDFLRARELDGAGG